MYLAFLTTTRSDILKLCERLDTTEFTPRLHLDPICLKLRLMQIDPFSNQPDGRPRAYVSSQNISSKIEHSLFALMFGMKMRRIVIVIYILITIPKKTEIVGITL